MILKIHKGCRDLLISIKEKMCPGQDGNVGNAILEYSHDHIKITTIVQNSHH